MLELKNVSYSVNDDAGTADILKDVSLCIEDRKFIVITGPNGGGKTSLAKAVMGIVPLTSGQIFPIMQRPRSRSAYSPKNTFPVAASLSAQP